MKLELMPRQITVSVAGSWRNMMLRGSHRFNPFWKFIFFANMSRAFTLQFLPCSPVRQEGTSLQDDPTVI